MGNSHHYALAALKERRAALASEITDLKKRLIWREQQLQAVDATINIFRPDFDPHTIPKKRPAKRFKLFRQGELSRLVLDALRTAGEPIRTYDVVGAILIDQGHGEECRHGLTARVRGNLQYLMVKRGLVAKIGSGVRARWALAEVGKR